MTELSTTIRATDRMASPSHAEQHNEIGRRLAAIGAIGVNVRDYGATGDGSDQTSLIQTACDAVPLGGALIFPAYDEDGVWAGDYCTTGLTIDRTIAILGIGAGPIFPGDVSGTVTESGPHLRNISTANDLLLIEPPANGQIHPLIRDIVLYGNADVVGATAGHVVHMKAAAATKAVSGWRLDNVKVMKGFDHGIFLDGNVFEGLMTNVYSVYNGDDGVSADDNTLGLPGEVAMVRVHCNANGRNGIRLLGGGGFNVVEASCSFNTAGGFHASGVGLTAGHIGLEANEGDQAMYLNVDAAVINSVGINYAGEELHGITFDACNGINIGAMITSGVAGGAHYSLNIPSGNADVRVGYYSRADWLNEGSFCEVWRGQYQTENRHVAGARLTYGASIAIPKRGGIYEIIIGDANNFTIESPAGAGNTNSEVTFLIYNASGGAHGTITFGAAYSLGGAFAAIANGQMTAISFASVDLGSNFYETARVVGIT